MKEQIYEYDPAAALDGSEAMAIFMADAFEAGDAQYIAKAMGVVARAKGMTELAQSILMGPEREQKGLRIQGRTDKQYHDLWWKTRR